MAKRFKTAMLALLGVTMALCLAFGAWLWLSSARVNAAGNAQAQNVEHSTVAVHDPSIVLAYEDAEGNTYHEAADGRTKVYYVFGTQIAQVKSYDLVNWTPFVSNLSDENTLFSVIPQSIRNYTGNTTASKLKENCWAPDVIYNRAMGKWCMYLSVNGADYNSVIVLLVADTLDGAWTYMGEVVYSGIRSTNVASTDFEKVTGSTTVADKYWVKRGSWLSYGLNAIDAAVTYDENGDLWMSYGSWYGGIYLLRLDKFTGLRDYSSTYENVTDGAIENNGTFTVRSDEYLGIHIAGGHQSSGEGSYLLKMGDWWYLFLSYGGYAPDGGYNMRVFRSDNIAGPYVDAAGRSAVSDGTRIFSAEIEEGVRVMSGYTWSWWDFSYISQGHNSAFVDDDGNAYLVYHNKYTDGTIFHVLKAHQLLVNADGWLVTAPFEATVADTAVSEADAVATGLTADEITGSYGYLFMTRNNGTYSNVCREQTAQFTYNSAEGTLLKGSVTGLSGINAGQTEGTWTYDSETGAFSITPSKDKYTYNGYLLYQNLEGTNIRTLAFTVVSTVAGSLSQYTYWGYRYPTTEQQAQYVVNSLAIPDRIGTGASVQTGVKSNGLWNNVKVTVSYENGTFTAAYLDGETPKTITKTIETSEKTAEYGNISAGQTLLPVDTANGISISFDYSNYSSDWTPILEGENFRINLSVIEYAATNIYEGAATNSGLVGSAANHEIFYTQGTARATISFNTDGSICFFLNDTLALTYSASAKFNDGSTSIGDVCRAVLSEFSNGTVKTAYDLSNVVIDKALSSAITTEVIYEIDDGYYSVTYHASEAAVNTNTDWWAGALGEKTLQEGNNALVYRYTRTHNYTDNAIQMMKPNEAYATFYPFGPLSEFATDWQTGGSVYYMLDGEPLTDTSDIKTGNVAGSSAEFWFGVYEISFIRYDNTLYVICDFIRTTGDYHLSAVYSFENISESLVVRFSGYCNDITDCTVAASESIVYSDTLPETDHIHSYTQSERTGNDCIGYTVTYTCSCGDSYTETDYTGVTGHSYTVKRTEPTCLKEGSIVYTCSKCGDSFTVVLPLAEHSWSESWSKDGAEHWHECTVCHEKKDVAAHVWDEGQVTSQATCTGEGVMTYTCTVCGGTKTEPIAALGHDYEWTVTLAPTKESEGTLTGVCSVCEDEQEITLPALNAEDYDVERVAATCESAGSEIYTYVKDGERYTAATITLPALGHSWGEWSVTKTPTETEKGQLTRTCTRDGAHTEMYELPVLGDVSYTAETVPASCTQSGSITYKLTKDGQEITVATVTLEALGHSWDTAWKTDGEGHWHECTVCSEASEKAAHSGGEATCAAKAVCEVCGAEYGEVDPDNHQGETYVEGYVAPTEDKDGYSGDIYCSDCDKLIQKGTNIPALSHVHEMEKVEAVAATCTEEGNIEYLHCSSCGNNYAVENPDGSDLPLTNVVLPALGHSWGEWSVTKAPTETEKGQLTRTCTRDGAHTETYELPVLDEASYTAEMVPATCAQAGSITYKLTKDGQEIVVATITLPALGHDYEWTVTLAPTKESEGTLTGVCSVCEDEQEITLPALNAEDYEVKTVAATCESAGSETYTYVKDGERYTVATITLPALGHDWDEGVVTTPATCTQDGVKTFTCTRCSAERTETIQATGHSAEEIAAVAPTCTQTGSTAGSKCSVCGEILQAPETVPALGHSWSEWTVTKQPSYTEEGEESRTCSVCNETETRAVAALGLGQKFADEAAAVEQAETRAEKFAAISQALTTYGQLSADEKAAVAEVYASLEAQISAYNASVEEINGEAESAIERALRVFSSAILTMGALAAVWFAVKKFN